MIKMTDVKDNMILVLRNGTKVIKRGKGFINIEKNVTYMCAHYNEDLTHTVTKDLDVVEIWFMGKDLVKVCERKA